MRNSSKYILGAMLVIFGVLVIFGNIGFFSLSWLFSLTWPMIFIGISLFFFLGYFTQKPRGVGLLVPGGTLFTLGVTSLIGEVFSYNLIWPGFIAAPAVGLLLLYLFGDRSAGLLVPVGTLMTIAGTCFLSELFGLWGILWPGFIMAPAVGLFLLYITDNRNPGLLIPIFILTGISVFFFSIYFIGFFGKYFKYIAGGILIIVGIGTIIKRPVSNEYNDRNQY